MARWKNLSGKAQREVLQTVEQQKTVIGQMLRYIADLRLEITRLGGHPDEVGPQAKRV